MDQKINDNQKFKVIFNNIDESIIIIKQENTQIDYVNNKFLSEFHKCILETISHDSFASEEQQTRFHKIIMWVKKLKR